MRKIAVLGSTGSIGKQTLEVIEKNKDIFNLDLISANSNYKLLAEQANKFQPKVVIICDSSKVEKLNKLIKNSKIEIFHGESSLNDFSKYCELDTVVTAVVGKSGLIPTTNAIKNNIDIALANKETLVIAGKYILDLVKNNNSKILAPLKFIITQWSETFVTEPNFALEISLYSLSSKKLASFNSILLFEYKSHSSGLNQRRFSF